MVVINVNIRKLHEDAVIPLYATEGAAAFDLVSVADVIIAPGETALVPIGLAFEVPVGYVMDIRPRSGITLNTKLRVGNAPGSIDSDFRGEVNVIIDNIAQLEYAGYLNVGVQKCRQYTLLDGGYSTTENTRNYRNAGYNDNYYDEAPREVPLNTYLIRKGDRIAQALIQRIPRVDFALTDELSETDRGEGGFGSSGVKSEEVAG